MPSTNARLREAFEEHRIIRVLEDDLEDPEDGAVWYNESEDEYRGAEAGTVVAFETTPVE